MADPSEQQQPHMGDEAFIGGEGGLMEDVEVLDDLEGMRRDRGQR